MLEGLLTEPIFERILELRLAGEELAEPAALEESLNAETRQVLYESLFWAVRAAQIRGRIDRHLHASATRRARREVDNLPRGNRSRPCSPTNVGKLRELHQRLS